MSHPLSLGACVTSVVIRLFLTTTRSSGPPNAGRDLPRRGPKLNESVREAFFRSRTPRIWFPEHEGEYRGYIRVEPCPTCEIHGFLRNFDLPWS